STVPITLASSQHTAPTNANTLSSTTLFRSPSLPVLVVSMHDAPDYLERVLKSGAQGFVNKKESIQRLSDAIRRVLSGRVYIGERSEEHTSELQSRENLVCRLLLEKKNRSGL